MGPRKKKVTDLKNFSKYLFENMTNNCTCSEPFDVLEDGVRQEQLDGAIEVINPQGIFAKLENTVLLEVKNRDTQSDKNDIVQLADKIRERHLKDGIFLSFSGYTIAAYRERNYLFRQEAYRIYSL